MKTSKGIGALRSLLLLAFFSFSLSGMSQQFSEEELAGYSNLFRFKDIEQLYRLNGYQFIWLTHREQQENFLQILHVAYLFGLDEEDYSQRKLTVFTTPNQLLNHKDSAEADVSFSNSALHFFSDLKIGNKPLLLSFDALQYKPDASSIVPIFNDYFHRNKLGNLLTEIQPASAEFKSALSLLNKYQYQSAVNTFDDVTVASKKADSTNLNLLIRLHQIGVIDTNDSKINMREITNLVIKAQQMFGLAEDGVIGHETLNALNIPINKRIEELKVLINNLRWLDQLKQSTVLLVNISAASLFVYSKGKIVFDSKIIVGKPATPTPTLSSVINEVVLYPYWMVPKKIATKELLPRIKRNPGYLSALNYQVLNNNGDVINPYAIRWNRLSRSYFPYTIRQSTGCDNSLGIIKFNFENPFSVYLHDTPKKELFATPNRFYSHGCMRVERTEALAHLLLGDNLQVIDTITAKGCLLQQQPIVLSGIKQLPIVVLYATAWYNLDGEIRFYGDVYNKNK